MKKRSSEIFRRPFLQKMIKLLELFKTVMQKSEQCKQY